MPGGAATRHMVNAAVLRELGPGGYLVNGRKILLAEYNRVRFDAVNVHAFFLTRGLDKGTTIVLVLLAIGLSPLYLL